MNKNGDRAHRQNRSSSAFRDLLEQLGKAHETEVTRLNDEISVLKKEVPPDSTTRRTTDFNSRHSASSGLERGIESRSGDIPKQGHHTEIICLKGAWTDELPEFVKTSESKQMEGAALSVCELETVEALFKKHDTNGDHELNREEFFHMMVELGNQMSRQYSGVQVEKWFMMSDVDGSGSIDFREFVQMQKKWARLNRPVSSTKSHVSGVTEAFQLSARREQSRHRSRCMLEPSSLVRLMWDIAGMVLIFYDMVTIPLMCFSPEDNTFTDFMGWLAMLFWTCDMAFSVNTGLRLADGSVVMDRSHIILHYLKTWFVVDLMVVVPDWTITILELSGGNGEGQGVARMSRMLRALRAIRILRLLRLAKLKKLVIYIYDAIDSEHLFIVVNLVRLIFVILLLNHYVACVWYAMGEITRLNGSDTGMNWLEDVGKTPVFQTSLGWRYTTSLHWSITQFTPASMDVFAVNLVERVFSIVILFWSLVALSSIIGSVSASMTQLRSLTGDKTKQFWLLRRYLKENQIEWSLRERILRYAEHKSASMSRKTLASKVALLATLSDPLKREISTAVYAPTLTLHPFFAHLEEFMPKILQRICQESIRQSSLAENDIVFRANEEASNMFFLKIGIFDYTLAGHHSPRRPPLGAKEWICELVLWSSWRYRGDLVAIEAAELLVVDPAVFATVMRRHPRSWHFGRRYAQKICQSINKLERAGITDLTFDDEVSSFVVQSDVYDDNGGDRRMTVLQTSSTRWSDFSLESSSELPGKVMDVEPCACIARPLDIDAPPKPV
eukprot:TRINITY_DN9746_c0_g1_i1.p1 TRINITY_DN9746_c0_g1~~TRINITY_DN9746_c0_g1_i1.p1  ORF type:complete len:785 (-),score=138.69 TRINITY_DN9746_c0_g1_i1:70-2424(-)